MKNYFEEENKSRDFIEKFEIVDDEIFVYLATGEVQRFPYTQKTHNELTKKLDKQALNGINRLNSLKRKTNYAKNDRRTTLIISILFLIASLFSVGSLFLPFFFAISVITLITSQKYKKKYLNLSSIVEDVEKHSVFLNMREELEKEWEKHEAELLKEVGDETREKIQGITPSRLDYGKLDDLSLEDLIAIRNNLEKIKESKKENISKRNKM